ncbi:MAG: C40 family peptidase [Oscillospiraceae bacterium]|jgi:3D (Asp-Asp-Asp) domain-containing protein|nr:C40 family peptidase [Lachnospiraceae bacterium]MBQ1776788.1 C40 family peptidase [Acidaminococcaceae bacterium]MBQ5523645.1 C40 family peptidase [Oscillospiraceae bacterium]MBQ1777691.1 C40 family peptidase [Acidaminococcaceae bacterium]MBQ2139496.1 C40 family peptidase [Acidaminococcaceae bacterium]
MRNYKQAAKLEAKADKANIEALYRKRMAENPQAAANPISRWRQRQAVKKEYAAIKAGQASAGTAAASSVSGSTAAASAGKAVKETKDVGAIAANFFRQHSHLLLVIGSLALVIFLIAGSLSSCSMLFGGTGNAVIGTSFTAEDEDIRGADEDYSDMEEALRERIREIEEDNPDYDEYDIDMSEIGHNPYVLAAFLTVLYEDYSRAEVQRTLREIFAAQYEFSTSHHTETVTETRQVRVGESLGQVVTSGYCNCPICCGIWSGGPTASGVYPTAEHTIAVDANNPFVPMGTKVVMNGVEYTVEDTGNFDLYGVQFDVYYDSHQAAQNHGHQTWEAFVADDNGDNVVEVTQTTTKRVLTVEVTNHSLETVIENWGLTDDQMERYRLLVQQKGNRDYLFPDSMYITPGGGIQYTIPGEALTDEKFAKMIREAEKYLGYPYVWGGSSPSTSFDCSGFVCWVINNCGNGWNVGRTTAEGLRQMLPAIRPSEAKPGDIIFFQGTYDTVGASHVGIYVGNGMMIHCGSPIQYASVNSDYFQRHFMCYCRLP